MQFLRALSKLNIAQMQTGESAHVLCDADFQFHAGRYIKLDNRYNAALFALLKGDVLKGEVFPAIRDDELHFYYKGGCLFKFVKGAFLRDSRYGVYGEGTEGLPPYAKAKIQNENKNTNKKGEITERQLLDRLYRNTYSQSSESKVVVLDIEVNLKGNIGWGKKCDLVLLNTQTDEIMFVEGKVYSDKRVTCAVGYLPEVIAQVDLYSAAIAEQRQNILVQYGEYVCIMNELFGTCYNPPRELIESAKLLVYKAGCGKPENVNYTINIINGKLGAGNVMWVKDGEPTLDEIWEALKGDQCR